MNPKSGFANRPMLGSITGILVELTPNHRASVAAYSSTLVVGIHVPRAPLSLGPPRRRSGI